MRKPGLQQIPRDVPNGSDTLTIDGIDQIGHYEIVAVDSQPAFVSGFSANLPNGESDFSRLRIDRLNNLLGEGRYEIANDIAELTRKVEYGRIGQEMFAFVLFFTIVVFCAEHIAANRFYATEQSPVHSAETQSNRA